MSERLKWLKWRHTGIGSSDAPIVMGVSPYRTPYQLWEEKIRDEPINSEPNFIQKKGIELEPIARERFSALWFFDHGGEDDFAPKLVHSNQYEFLKASLDGCSKDGKTIIEIKFQGAADHLATAKGVVPKKYFPQVQHALLVSGADVCYFVSFDGVTLFYTEVRPDYEYWKLYLATCIEFWKCVQTKTPPALLKKDERRLAKALRKKAEEQSENLSDSESVASSEMHS